MPGPPIALDATYSLDRNLSGVGVYCRELLSGVTALKPEQRFLFAYRGHRIMRSFRERLPRNASRALLRSTGIVPWGCRLFHGLNQRIDSRFRRSVATFHDLFVLTGDYSTADFRARFAEQARRAAHNADLVIAVSSFTAGQVRDLLQVEPARIRVIHHGVRFPDGDPPSDAQRENIILHIGAIQKRKNLIRLIEAFEQTAPGWRLVLAGAAGYQAGAVLDRAHTSPRSRDIELTGYVSDSVLEALYRRARIFAFPSLDEGFGMPVIDAMARGVPVLTSNGSALAEVAGDCAVLVDPSDAGQVAAELRELTLSGGRRMELRRKGLERARFFSWAKAVEQTWAVYEELF